MRSSIADAPPPTFSCLQLGASFCNFRSVTVDDVVTVIRRLPDKSSPADPIPTSVLKQVSDVITPCATELFNRSSSAGHFPARFNEALVTAVIKKAVLDATDVSSYRPISNLSVLSKLLERLAVQRLMDYLKSFNLLPQLQSGFGSGHSTETAVLRGSDILQAVYQGDVAALFGPVSCV